MRRNNLKFQKILAAICLLCAVAALFVPLRPSSLNVYESSVYVEGLSEDVTVLMVSDTHCVVKDDVTDKDYVNRLEAEFVDKNGNLSSKLLKNIISYVNRRNRSLQKDIDLVVLGGDIIAYPSEANVNFLKSELGRLNAPYLYTMGNHDWTYEWDYMTEEGRQEYLPLFDELYSNGTERISFVDTDEIRFIQFDNSANFTDGKILESFKEYSDTDKRIVVCAHVPYDCEGLAGDALYMWPEGGVALGDGSDKSLEMDEDTKALADFIGRDTSNVVHILAGHTHFYTQRKFNSQITETVAGPGYKGDVYVITFTGKAKNNS